MFLMPFISVLVQLPPFHIQPSSAHAWFNSTPSMQMSPGSANSNTSSTAASIIFLRPCFCHIIFHLKGLQCLWSPSASSLTNVMPPYSSQPPSTKASLLTSQDLHMIFFHNFYVSCPWSKMFSPFLLIHAPHRPSKFSLKIHRPLHIYCCCSKLHLSLCLALDIVG